MVAALRPQSVWAADDSEPVLDTTVGSILRDAARRSPAHHRPGGRERRPDAAPAVDLRRAPRRRRARRRRRWSAGSSPASAWPWWPRASPSRSSSPTPPALAGLVLVPVNPALRAARAPPRARAVGCGRASSSCPTTGATTSSPRCTSFASTCRRCARSCPSTSGTRSARRATLTRGRQELGPVGLVHAVYPVHRRRRCSRSAR